MGAIFTMVAAPHCTGCTGDLHHLRAPNFAPATECFADRLDCDVATAELSSEVHAKGEIEPDG